MLRSLCQRCRHIRADGSAALLNTVQEAHQKCLSTSSQLLTVQRGFDRQKDAVRQPGTRDDTFNRSGQNFPGEKQFGNFTFPTVQTFSQTINGVPFDRLPVVHIKATSNNTIISAADGDGVVLALQSGGTVGFRNARRGTTVAAQAAGIAISDDVLRKNIKDVRVCLKGIGPGRLPALKAIQMSGINVVSITDTTPLPHNGNRPKKVRRL